MKFINSEVNELKGKTDNNLQEIKALTCTAYHVPRGL